MSKNTPVRWLQLSDLHIFYSTEWEIMLKSYEELAKVFHPDFIVVTGDFRHKKQQKKYDIALSFLNKMVEIFSLSKTDFFFVPGNHDVTDFKMRKEIIATIKSSIDSNPDSYVGYTDRLSRNGFTEYTNFVRKFYGDSLSKDGPRIATPSSVYILVWQGKLNIVTLNSALISDGGDTRNEIVDIQKLSQISSQIDKSKPTIILAHHAISALVESQKPPLERLLSIMNARVYLCGDEHKVSRTVANKFDIGNQTVGIICGKSATQQGDSYSDVCVIGYTWQGSDAVVDIFKWIKETTDTPYQFIKSDMWYHHIDKPFSFKLSDAILPSVNTSEQMAEAWDTFLKTFQDEDEQINSKLGEKQVTNKSGNSEPFRSEKIMRSLIMIGIPFPAVSEIAQRTIETILSLIPQSSTKWILDTKTIRLTVLESIRALDGKKWAADTVGNWCIRYIRRYGHNNRIIQFCNIPEEINNGITVHNANYKFIKEVFLPDLFQTVRPSFDMKRISSAQKTNLAEEIIAFINGCDLYIIDYVVFKNMILEIVTKPPHPWIIDDRRRAELLIYDRDSVESNLSEMARCEQNNTAVPLAVFIELLHHVSAMMLDKYFSFCGCADLDAFSILKGCFKNMIDGQFNLSDWDIRVEDGGADTLLKDFERHDISVSAYYEKLCAISHHDVKLSNTPALIAAIKDFANESLKIIDLIEGK